MPKMKGQNLILKLIEKSINAFGEVHGLAEEDKLRAILSITQNTIRDSFDINSSDLSEKKLSDILAKDLLDLGQAQQLTNLLWTQAEILLQLNQLQDSMTQYKNALQLLYWKERQPVEKGRLERKNKITELETIIRNMKLPVTTNTIQ